MEQRTELTPESLIVPSASSPSSSATIRISRSADSDDAESSSDEEEEEGKGEEVDAGAVMGHIFKQVLISSSLASSSPSAPTPSFTSSSSPSPSDLSLAEDETRGATKRKHGSMKSLIEEIGSSEKEEEEGSS